MMFCSATVTLPWRADVSGFSVPATTATPLPVPLAPDTIDSHEAFARAVHAQLAAVVTVTLTLPPVAPIVVDDGAIWNVQAGEGFVGEPSQAVIDARTAAATKSPPEFHRADLTCFTYPLLASTVSNSFAVDTGADTGAP